MFKTGDLIKNEKKRQQNQQHKLKKCNFLSTNYIKKSSVQQPMTDSSFLSGD